MRHIVAQNTMTTGNISMPHLTDSTRILSQAYHSHIKAVGVEQKSCIKVDTLE